VVKTAPQKLQGGFGAKGNQGSDERILDEILTDLSRQQALKSKQIAKHYSLHRGSQVEP
jgi:hypothetical protein